MISDLSRLVNPSVVGVLAALSGFSIGCYEQQVSSNSEAVDELIAAARRTFQANYDSDRREEAGLLYARTPMGATEQEVREYLGGPTPGVSDADKWIYELGGRDTFTLYFRDGTLRTKHWLTGPVDLRPASPALEKPVESGDGNSVEALPAQESTPDGPARSAEPGVSQGANETKFSR